jgi:hypothetical protein
MAYVYETKNSGSYGSNETKNSGTFGSSETKNPSGVAITWATITTTWTTETGTWSSPSESGGYVYETKN